MFSKLLSILNNFQSRFTYRQRFVFFAIIYIVAMPAPSFWMIKAHDFYIANIDLQDQGNEYQKIISTLFTNVLEHQVATFLKHTKEIDNFDDLALLETSISEQFEALKIMKSQGILDPPTNLTSGFSNPLPPNPQWEIIEKQWDEYLKNQEVLSHESINDVHLKIAEQLQSLLRDISFTFGLVLNSSMNAHELFQAIIYGIPEIEILIVKLFFLKEGVSLESQYKDDLAMHLKILTNWLEKKKEQPPFNPEYYANFEEVPFQINEIKMIIKAQSHSNELLSNFFKYLHNSPSDFSANPKKRNNAKILKLLVAYDEFRKSNTQLVDSIIDRQKTSLSFSKWLSISLLITCTIFVSSIVMFRLLTRHLHKLLDHIQELAKGKFSKCFCSNLNDDFGQVGIAFDKVTQSIQEVVGELQSLGNLLSGFTTQISRAASEQESTVDNQEEGLKEIEAAAKEIMSNAKYLATKMNEINLNSKKTSLADTAKIKLDRMQENMSELTQASSNIVEKLIIVQNKVDRTSSHIEFMTTVSDQAKLLSLNAAIETANVEQHKKSFNEITLAIESFSDQTASSTQEIKNIIDQMSISVKKVRQDANRCLKEISVGAERLIVVSHQLTSITKQQEEQIKKFETANSTMQEQDIAGTTMIESIFRLGQSAKGNTGSLKQLHTTIEEIGNTATELQNVLERLTLKRI
jgi:methyl-accepting chemotaxis protein WspA